MMYKVRTIKHKNKQEVKKWQNVHVQIVIAVRHVGAVNPANVAIHVIAAAPNPVATRNKNACCPGARPGIINKGKGDLVMKLQKCVDSCMAAGVGVHFVCCGLPVILALIGGAGALIPVPHNVMTVILVVSGCLLAASIVMEFFVCACHRSRRRLVMLGLCIVLYAIGLCGHLGVFVARSSLTGEEIVLQCH